MTKSRSKLQQSLVATAGSGVEAGKQEGEGGGGRVQYMRRLESRVFFN